MEPIHIIHRGSMAWEVIERAIENENTHTILLAELTESTVKVKVNAGMWSAPLQMHVL